MATVTYKPVSNYGARNRPEAPIRKRRYRKPRASSRSSTDWTNEYVGGYLHGLKTYKRRKLYTSDPYKNGSKYPIPQTDHSMGGGYAPYPSQPMAPQPYPEQPYPVGPLDTGYQPQPMGPPVGYPSQPYPPPGVPASDGIPYPPVNPDGSVPYPSVPPPAYHTSA